MKLEIIPKEKLVGEIDLEKFIDIMKQTNLDLQKAVYESVVITKNETGWKIGYIINVLVAELDWAAVLMNLKWKGKQKKLYFKMCPIKFKDKVEYERYAKSRDFRKIILKENRKTGENLILINSFNPNPEHNIDIWLGKSTFPYLDDKWKEEIIEET